MLNRSILIGSIVLIAIAGLALATLAASSFTLFSGGTSPSPPASTSTTITEIGKTTITSTMQWPVRKLPENLTGTVYKTSVVSRGLNLTMEYNGTRLRFGEVIALRLTLENVNHTGLVGIHEDLIPREVKISNYTGLMSKTGGDQSNRPIVTLKPGDKISTLTMWDNMLIFEDHKANKLIMKPILLPGTYQITGEVTLLDPADGHQLFTIETQPVTIEILPS